MKNIDKIRNMSDDEVVELIYNSPFDCSLKCEEFAVGCLKTCKHDKGREFIRAWLNEDD